MQNRARRAPIATAKRPRTRWLATLFSLGVGGVISAFVAPVASAVPVAAGYQVSEIAFTADASGSVLFVGGSLFYGDGGFGVGSQSVLRLDADGTRTPIASGFNAIAGLAYDAVNDRLIVGDNGGDQSGALTGDTLFGLANPFADPVGVPSAAGLELLAAGTLPGVSDLVLDPANPNRVFASDSVAGTLWEIDLSAGSATAVQTGLGFAAGLAEDGSTLFLGDVDASLFTGLVSRVALSAATNPLTPIAAGLAGQFDLTWTSDGRLLGTMVNEILELDPVTGATSVLASGLGFATGISEDNGTIFVVDGDFFSTGNRLYRLQPIPEPSTALLIAAGLAGLGAIRRR